jgi:uncharacterized protein YciI
MKHFLIEITYLVSAEQLGDVVAEHRAFLQTGYDRGWLLFSGPLVPRTGGVVVGRAPTLDDIQAFFKNDPYQLKGLAVYRFAEFNPVKQQAFLEDWVAGK